MKYPRVEHFQDYHEIEAINDTFKHYDIKLRIEEVSVEEFGGHGIYGYVGLVYQGKKRPSKEAIKKLLKQKGWA